MSNAFLIAHGFVCEPSVFVVCYLMFVFAGTHHIIHTRSRHTSGTLSIDFDRVLYAGKYIVDALWKQREENE